MNTTLNLTSKTVAGDGTMTGIICPTCGHFEVLSRSSPDYNPRNLTKEQIGEGWRLLTEDDLNYAYPECYKTWTVQAFCMASTDGGEMTWTPVNISYPMWVCRATRNHCAYRTTHSPEELRKFRVTLTPNQLHKYIS